MRILLLVMAIALTSCSPIKEEPRNYATKYPDSATMGAAEDASKTNFNENSFNH
jgi:hypothetical protein